MRNGYGVKTRNGTDLGLKRGTERIWDKMGQTYDPFRPDAYFRKIFCPWNFFLSGNGPIPSIVRPPAKIAQEFL